MLLCSTFFRALWRAWLNSVADRPSPCLTSLLMTNGLLIFPYTITLACAPYNVIFTSRSILLGIPKLVNDSKSFFWFILSKAFLKSMKRRWRSISWTAFFQYLL
jgi:hypothetical protein